MSNEYLEDAYISAIEFDETTRPLISSALGCDLTSIDTPSLLSVAIDPVSGQLNFNKLPDLYELINETITSAKSHMDEYDSTLSNLDLKEVEQTVYWLSMFALPPTERKVIEDLEGRTQDIRSVWCDMFR